MAKIERLSNHTRALQRAPLLTKPASGALIARLLPRGKPAVARRQSHSTKASSNGREKSARQAAQAAPNNGRTFSNAPATPPPSLRLPSSQPGKFTPKPDASKNPYTADRPVSQQPAKNGHSTPPPAAKNGSRSDGHSGTSRNGFGSYPRVKPDLGNIESVPPTKPAVQMPLEPGDTIRENPARRTQPVASEVKPVADPAPRQPVIQPAKEQVQTPQVQKPVGQRKHSLAQALKKIFTEQPDLPAQAAILGVGEDNMPVLLDLYDPAPGALVVIGDERDEQLDILRSAVISLAERTTPRSMQIMILSCDPGQWRQWIAEQGYERFCVGIEGVDDQDALRDWIIRLGDWTEERRTGQRSGPPILVVLDTLSFLPRLSYDIRLNFEWLAKEGPAAQIWPLAAISSELAQILSSRHLLRSFHTQILGFVDRPDFYVRQASLSPEAAEEFGEPGVFAVQVGDGWLRMRLPGR